VEAKLGMALVLRNLGRYDESSLLLKDMERLHPDQLELSKLLGLQAVDLEEIP
jgi:hypothetical protein